MKLFELCAICATVITTACTSTVDTNPTQTATLDDDFAVAANDYGVPVDLVKAVAFTETRWNMVTGNEEHEGRPAGFGLFALWGENLSAGAAAAGYNLDVAQTNVTANIAAGAARLAEIAVDLDVTGDNLAAWQPVLEKFAQSDDPEVRTAYATDVYTALANGATSIAEDGTAIATLPAHNEIEVSGGTPRAASGDYPGAVWRASPNFSGRSGSPVSLVVIHTCEGAYAGCWGWLKSAASQVSAHYVVKEDGSEITQLVREASKAWHIAAEYACSRNGNTMCANNGKSTNNFSIGIEHAGFESQTSFSAGQIEASAKLTCDITRDNSIPRDRNHIVGHGQLQPWNRIDPGPNWPWAQYIDRVRAFCGDDGTTPPTTTPPGATPPPSSMGSPIIIDSNNANNDSSVAKISLAGTWSSLTSTPGYYGTGYWQATTTSTSSPATFSFYVAAAGPRTIDAWWTTGANRSAAAPFIAFNATGTEVGRTTANQKANGSQWVTLGTWNFTAGWNTIVLSRSAPGAVVIADAVRVR